MQRNDAALAPVVVAGDITIDWNIAHVRERVASGLLTWNADDTSRACPQRGGALLLADLLDWLFNGPEEGRVVDRRVLRPAVNPSGILPGDLKYHHSYAMWSPFPGPDRSDVWRVEGYLGMDIMQTGAKRDHLAPPTVPGAVSLYALDDADLGFRGWKDMWPEGATAPGDAWVIVKTASPVALGSGAPEGKASVWEQLVDVCGDRLVVVMTADDLRLTEVQISRELSWERVGEDLFWELVHSTRVQKLSECAHVVISLGTSGALWLRKLDAAEGADVRNECTLFFDAEGFEGQWKEKRPGGMIGYTTCLTAGIAGTLVDGSRAPDVARGIQAGLRAMRVLHEGGYGKCEEEDSEKREDGVEEPSAEGDSVEKRRWPSFPFRDVVAALKNDRGPELACCCVPHPRTRGSRSWSVLDDRCTEPPDDACVVGGSLHERAESVVKHGVSPALDGVPMAHFGHLVTADRHEIEGYRSIRGLLSEYCRREAKKPISIAVFGPPGSGKSFGVKQVAKSISKTVVTLEFNLSQFGGPDQMVDALHQVRDIGLSGKIPLVFWDEFDSRLGQAEYGWLRYFLAPMQDGSFQHGQITHHIGRAIFVFAGGTRPRMSEFVATVSTAEMRSAKGPDFVSRLKGYVDVLGPNPLDKWFPRGDPHFVVRRAIILRSLFTQWAPHLFDDGAGEGTLLIDEGVLRAFLYVSSYRHGVRSMESIIAMSTLAGKSRFERSSLPGRAQLDLHVDGTEFLSMVHQPDFTTVIDKLAGEFHEIFRSNNPKSKYGGYEFAGLPEEIKEDNRENARDMARKLAATGHVMMPRRGGEKGVTVFSDADLEKMAEMEHERWVRFKVANGWRCVILPAGAGGPKPGSPPSEKHVAPRDDDAKIHTALRPWQRLTEEEKELLDPELLEAMCNLPLSEEDKEKDRDQIRGFPDVAKKAGYVIVKLRGSDERPDAKKKPNAKKKPKARKKPKVTKKAKARKKTNARRKPKAKKKAGAAKK